MKTSANSPIQVGLLTRAHHGMPGRIGLTIAPGKKDHARSWNRDLDADLARLRSEYDGTLLVSLLEKHEYDLLKIPDLVERALDHGFESLRYAIVDVSIPASLVDALRVAKHIVVAMARGQTVIIHCRGGIGRSGLMAAACLVVCGVEADEAIARVRSVRPGAVETAEQEQWVHDVHAHWSAGAAPRVAPSPLYDRIRGCLLGGAIGDALGYPVEFDDGSRIEARLGMHPPARLTVEHDVALVSDDTQMTLFTAEGLIRAWQRGHERGIGPDIKSVVGRALLRWFETQTKANEALDKWGKGWLVQDRRLWSRRAPGTTCMSSLATLMRDAPDFQAQPTPERPGNSSKGCGAVMRAAPFGLAMTYDEQAFDIAVEASVLTHGHPSGYLSGGYLAAVVWHVARGTTLSLAMKAADAFLKKRTGHEELRAIVARARKLAKAGPPTRAAIESLGGGWTGEEALAIALLCALTAEPTAEGTRAALWRAAAHSGDSDSTAAICGNLLGAMGGMAVLPPAWLEEVELREVIERLAEDLDRTWHRREAVDRVDYPPN